MERKKVAILLPWLKMGGTNKIAINFMAELSKYCDVTLILSENSGELLQELPGNIKVLVDTMKTFQSIFKDDVKHFRIGYLIKDIIYYSKIKLGLDSVDNYRYIVKRHDFISDVTFDCAISYHGQSPERLLNLIYRIHAKKKVAWIHGEISFSNKKCIQLRKYYQQMDHFFFVSSPTMESFQKVIGFDAAKGTVYYNPIDKSDILRRASEVPDIEFDMNRLNLLTVGRISAEKGQDMIPAITRSLVDKGIEVCWYIIGDGDSRKQVEALIRQYKVENYVKLLGVKTNPYCYMKNCDIYVQPSYTEGYSTTICEAAILGKPIIGTVPSGGIRDQLIDGQDGLIVEATVDGLTDGIYLLAENESLRSSFGEKISEKNFEGKGEIQKFMKFLNE